MNVFQAQWTDHFGKNNHMARGTSGDQEGLSFEEPWMPVLEAGIQFCRTWESYIDFWESRWNYPVPKEFNSGEHMHVGWENEGLEAIKYKV